MSVSESIKRLSAPLRRKVVWSLLVKRARANGLDPGELRRIENYLDVSFRLKQPRFADPQQNPRNYMEGLTAKPWHDTADFPWTRRLEESCDVVREELSRMRSSGNGDGTSSGGGSADHTQAHPGGIPVAGTWKVFYFNVIGQKRWASYRDCPRTGDLVDSIPGLSSIGLSYFSVLTAGTHVTPHCGPTNARLRAQLAVIVPSGCRFRVGSETRSWEAGRCWIFDGSFEHEVWHDGSGDRVVLIADFWHPDLTIPERWALTEMTKLSRDVRHYWKDTYVH